MKKARQFLGIFLALLLSLSLIPANLARADNLTNEKTITSIRENTNDKEVIEKYSKGITDEPFQVEARKNFATEKGLLGEVDSNYFLNEDYVFSKSIDYLEQEKLAILVNPIGSIQEDISTNGVTIQSAPSNSEISNSPSNYTISSDTSEGSIRSRRSVSNAPERLVVNNPGPFIQYYQGIRNEAPELFINGNVAFCVNFELETPPTGTVANNKRVSNNLALRKALYYGYKGPAEVKTFTSNEKLLMIATTNAASGANGHKTYNIGRHFTAHIANLPAPPDNFVVYIVSTSPGSLQDLAYWEIKQVPKKGKFRIKKETSNLEVSKQNNYYTTNGAVYGVYKDKGATQKIGELKTTNKGWSDYIEVDAGTYYLKELQAPEGFQISTNVESVVVEVGKTMPDKVVYDKPKADPVALLIQKVDSRTGQANPSLAGAEFTFKFYAGKYTDGVDPGTQGIKPTRTWVLRTNDKGQVFLANSNKVSGDAFYYNGTNNPTLPMGTLTIQETKAPNGYRINTQLIVKNIKPGNGPGGTQVFQTPTIQEDSVNFQLRKIQKYSDIGLPGVKFKYTNSDGKVSELTTDGNGNINIYGLKQGTHKIVETTPVPGYIKNGNEFVFEVTKDNKVVAKTDVTDKGMYFDNRGGDNGYLTVSNMVKNYKLKIVKVSEGDTLRLKGAQFTLYSDKALKKVIATKKTNDKGEIIFENLTPGVKYYAKETKSPDGYVIMDGSVKEIVANITPVQNKFDFWVNGTKYTSSTGDITIEGDKDNRVAGIKFRNKRVDFQIRKVQTGTDIVIPGVKFRHTKPDGSTEDLVTANDGTLNILGVTRGRHKVVEIETATGYILNGNEFIFDVNENNEIVVRTDLKGKGMHFEYRGKNGFLQVSNAPSNYSFRITKVNNHGAMLEGAEFTLYDKDTNSVVQKVVTDTQGIATFTNLVPGKKYYYKETKAPKGYEIPLNPDGSEITMEIYATSIPVQDKFSIFINGIEHTSTSQDGSIIIEGDKTNRIAGMTVVNDVLMKLPETGSNMMIPLLLIGSFLMLSYVYLDRKSLKKIN